MQKHKSSVQLLQLCVIGIGVLEIGAVLVALESPAQAYVDPGSGYVLLQVLGSMAVGALYYVRHRLRKVLWMIRGKRDAEPEEEQENSADGSQIAEAPKADR